MLPSAMLVWRENLCHAPKGDADRAMLTCQHLCYLTFLHPTHALVEPPCTFVADDAVQFGFNRALAGHGSLGGEQQRCGDAGASMRGSNENLTEKPRLPC